MKTKFLNYKVLIEKEEQPEGNSVYVTQVPTLGISDFGQTIEEALENTKKLIKFHVESLLEENETIPSPDSSENVFVANQKVGIRTNKILNFA